jgi:glutathione S-transferase
LSILTQAVANKEFIVGGQFTGADVVIGGLLRFGMAIKALPETVEFKTYVDRLTARPAFQRAFKKDMELAQAAN